MKLQYLFAAYALLTAALTAHADVTAAITPDTIAVIDNARHLNVTRTGKRVSVTVEGAGGDSDAYYTISAEHETSTPLELTGLDSAPAFPFTGSGHRSALYKTTWFSNVIIGAAVPVDAPSAMRTSIEAGIPAIVASDWTPWNYGPTFSIGVGINYRQFAVGDRMRLTCADRHLALEPVEENVDSYSSRLRIFSFTMPVMLKQRIYRALSCQAGAVINFNSYAQASTKYRDTDNYSYSASFKGLHQRHVTVDVMASLLISDIGVYVKYSPMSLFSDGYGPDMKAVSVGLVIAY